MFLPAADFCKCQKGVVAIIFVIMLVPFILLIGAAINYSDANSKEAQMQALMDSAVLAAASAKDITDEERVKLAERHFRGAMPDQLADLAKQVQFSVDGEDITGTVQTAIPSPIMGLFGLADARLNQKAVATFREDNRQLDMVFCIDATSSMQNTIDAVRNNAMTLENNLNVELEKRGLSKFAAMRVRVIFFRDFGYDQGDPSDYRSYNTPMMMQYYVDDRQIFTGTNGKGEPIYAPNDPILHPFNENNRYLPTDHPTDKIEVKIGDTFKTLTLDEAREMGISRPMVAATNQPAMRESKGGDFYTLSSDRSFDESSDFRQFVANEKAFGGGDEPEAGFACLNSAIRSNWAKTAINGQGGDDLAGQPGHKITTLIPLIVLWTDANALPLNNMQDSLSDYPYSLSMPSSLNGLTDNWNDSNLISQKDKLFVFFGNKDNNSRMCYSNTYQDETGKWVTPDAGPDCKARRFVDSVPRWRDLDGWKQSVTGGTLTQANNGLVKKLADALEISPSMPRLME